MEQIKVSFLGTGNAIPSIKRNHTAIFNQLFGKGILVDCGEGTQRQFMQAKISHNKIDKILITHWHGDHILGLPGLLQTMAMEDYRKELEIYGPKGTKKAFNEIKKMLGSSSQELKIRVIEIQKQGKIIDNENYVVECASLKHGTPCLGYSIKIKDKRRINKKSISKFKLPNSPILKKLQLGKNIVVDGKKIEAKKATFLEKGKKITFILDTHRTESATKLAKDSDLLICESTFLENEREKADEALHLTAKDAATIAKKSKSKKLALVHISQRYENQIDSVKEEANKVFKNTIIPVDLESLEI